MRVMCVLVGFEWLVSVNDCVCGFACMDLVVPVVLVESVCVWGQWSIGCVFFVCGRSWFGCGLSIYRL